MGDDELRETSKVIMEDFAERKKKIQQEYAAALHWVFFEEGIKLWSAWSMEYPIRHEKRIDNGLGNDPFPGLALFDGPVERREIKEASTSQENTKS